MFCNEICKDLDQSVTEKVEIIYQQRGKRKVAMSVCRMNRFDTVLVILRKIPTLFFNWRTS